MRIETWLILATGSNPSIFLPIVTVSNYIEWQKISDLASKVSEGPSQRRGRLLRRRKVRQGGDRWQLQKRRRGSRRNRRRQTRFGRSGRDGCQGTDVLTAADREAWISTL